jgi:putative salt-induced outer membrane protein YdiY
VHFTLRLFTVFILVAVVANSAFAQSESTPPWQPPPPSSVDRDWIRLVSGEWLMGDIKGMRDQDFDFDSEELDMLTLDWDDIVEVRSARILTYRFEGYPAVSGTMQLREDVVAVMVNGQVREYPKDDLIVIIEGDQSEWNYWSAKASFGMVARSGNTDQADVNTFLNIRRRSPRLRFDNRYTGNFGKVSGTENINNHNLVSTLDALLTAGFFVTPATVNWFADEFQNVDSRLTLGAGAGYAIMRDGDVTWTVGLSLGYLSTGYVSVQPGQEPTEKSGVLIPSTDLEWDVTGDIEFSLLYNAQISFSGAKNTYHHAEAMLSVDVWGDLLDLDWGFTWDHVENPTENADGVVPQANDYRTSVGLGVEI